MPTAKKSKKAEPAASKPKLKKSAGAAAKVDLWKRHKAEYAARHEPAIITIGPVQYLSITGQGAPGGELFTAHVGALYAVAFTIKMTRKFAGKGDYKVCPLQGQWWGSGKTECFFAEPRETWNWKLLIRTPEFIAPADLRAAVEGLVKKGKDLLVRQVALETIEEGLCVQMLHVGPYSEEPASIARMLEFAAARSLKPHGRHHELYLSDPRRVAPQRLRTILRQPVK